MRVYKFIVLNLLESLDLRFYDWVGGIWINGFCIYVGLYFWLSLLIQFNFRANTWLWLINLPSQDIWNFLRECLKSGIMNITSTKFIGKVISSLIIKFGFRLKSSLSLRVILNQGNLFVHFLPMEDVIGSLTLRTFILYKEILTGYPWRDRPVS